MLEFFVKNFEIFGFIIVFLLIILFCLPLVFVGIKGSILFSGILNKRALIFSFANAFLVTLILITASVLVSINIADENAGSVMIMLIKISVGMGLGIGFGFSYLTMYLISTNLHK